ncbi:conserved exported hypothetical protein [Vibrio chagasii]|uniref:hypothetical protein n=2 Tax=Vibrionaceae TaxID=641 RepID=UPI001EFE3510|nr:hypothetical protein [Vibrio chagasii]MDE9380123.1 hypothetical protein [Vibrio alginolyticus]MCG9561009.1 hypothetical protein [Vibrio chagasii]MCG9604616.1 hypothetical protein [Vibrio chagasii]CAH6831935.1 conserved exported hypothetical protein [Vibrio chagasii]CAH6864825.1 conserved exported hypothetical protein [Vibrio chagasii]
MKFSPIYAALLTSLASISAANAAQHSQNIAEGYGAANIDPHRQCLDFNPHGASQFCVANFKPEGLTLEPNQKVLITTPVSFPQGEWYQEQAPAMVVIRGSDAHDSICSSLGNSQWSCVLPESDFYSTGMEVEMWVADGVRRMWGGELTVDDLVEPVPMEACIDRAIASIELWKHQGFDSYRYTAEKLHLALEGLPTIPYQDTIDENALILDILHTCALQSDEVPALLKP